ncbi:MAG: succinate dehydrogenase, cytochrome b556 subunit [Hyphomonadaceae bacterium]|nr:succinate dehydrogenase, cytochrome b556 subunit [Hyphomonadaceae bacterium]
MAASAPEPNLGSRPLSPHLQVWRWHVTMLTSILNRMTGAGLTAGAIGVVIWLAALAGGPARFATAEAVVKSLPGQVILFLLALAAAFHFAAGVRHLIWDAGRGLNPQTSEASAWAALIFAVLAPIGLWALAGAF